MSKKITSFTTVIQGNTTPGIVRQLYMEAEEEPANALKHFAIYFTEETPKDLGYVNPDDGYIVPFLPLRDFAEMNEMLHKEKNVYADWFAGDDKKLLWFLIASCPDAVGSEPRSQSIHSHRRTKDKSNESV